MFLSTLKNKSNNIIIIFTSYIYILWKAPLSRIFISSNSELIFDIYYLYVKLFLIILLKHSIFRFNKLSDLVVYDRPRYKLRYVVVYIISNNSKETNLKIRFAASSKFTIISSITTIIYTANWAEREAMDMFGIKFLGHPDLRRIIGDYGLWGFPGRKDFPLIGLYTYFYSLNYLRVFRIRGLFIDFWSIYFQKKINK